MLTKISSGPFVCAAALACCALLVCTQLIGQINCAKTIKCQDADECLMKDEHFKLYSTIKQALESDFNMKGKDIVPFVRTVDVLKRRFAPNGSANLQLNGTKSILNLVVNSDKVREAIEVFSSNEGRSLVDLYKASINGQNQNLACSQWRVGEIEFAARQLSANSKLAKYFSNIHRNFVEKSARKCLKSACSSIDDNMNRLDSIRRHSSRRKGFMAREGLFDESAANPSLDELVAQVENEPVAEFHDEELELCQFLKRTNATNCQASAGELSEISFLKAIKVNNETIQSDLNEFLSDYSRNKWTINDTVVVNDDDDVDGGGASASMSNKRSVSGVILNKASQLLLTQCRSLVPSLDYHLYGLRWYQKQDLITSHKMQSRTFWCPSLAYWLEIGRLCNELEVKLADKAPTTTNANTNNNNENNNNNKNNNNNNNNNNNMNSQTFAY